MLSMLMDANSSTTEQLGNVAVVLIDMQENFLRTLWGGDRDTLIEAQVRVLEHCAKKDVPVFVLEYEGSGRTVTPLLDALSLVPRVSTVPKDYDNGFKDTDLDQQLRTVGARHLLLMGINASFCVFDTARSAQKRGYQLTTAASLIADINTRPNRRRAHRWYRMNGIMADDGHDVLTT